MKIVIIGPHSIPWQVDIKKYLTKEDSLYFKTPHPHPWIYNLALGLARIEGNQVFVITMTGDVKEDKIIEFNGVTFYILKSTSRYLKSITLMQSDKWKVHKLLKKINPDIVHGQSRGKESYFAVSSKYPSIITNHGQIKEEFRIAYPKKKPLRYYFNRIFECIVNYKLKFGIGVSPDCTKDLEKYTKTSNVFLIDNAIDPIYFNSKEANHRTNILYIGGIVPKKRLLELIKIVENIEGVKLMVISHTESGNYFEIIQKYIKERNLIHRIEFLGYKNPSQILNILQNTSVLCLPSYYESFGMVFCEAMASGVIPIGPNTGGVPFVIKDGKTGYLFNTMDLSNLKDKIILSLSNNDKVQQIRINAKLETRKRWHPDIVAQKTMAAYSQVIKSQRISK